MDLGQSGSESVFLFFLASPAFDDRTIKSFNNEPEKNAQI
jgi:hypothetical protein